MIGTTIGHYTIESKLGEGGMGVVYKATDTKLNRPVALKFLPDRVQKDTSAKARFLQEAQAAAGLNHPNICTIHGVEEADGSLFMVMEYVEGGELRGKIPFARTDEAIKIAAQIGEALQEAHAKGIVHRDIKSDNIMLTSKGQAKVMDFGLAKLKGALKLTRTSSTVGTLGYMAPEQIQAGDVDHRSDIFSFGVLLFEMLTGTLPFRGEHEAAMVYSIVNEPPQDISTVKPDLSPLVVNLLNRCLEKDPDDRYQTMQDAVSELRRSLKKSSLFARRGGHESIRGDVTGTPPAPSDAAGSTPSPRAPLFYPFVASVAVIVLLAVLAGILFLRTEAPVELLGPDARIYRFTSTPGLEDNPSWSPDGKFLAFVTDERGQTDIVIQSTEGGNPVRTLDNPANESQPSWSPDGSLLAFVSSRDHGGLFATVIGWGNLNLLLDGKGGDIFIVQPFGGDPLKLVSNGFDPAWSPDGSEIVFRSARDGQWDLWRVRATGGEPVRITNDAEYDYQPVWSPDGTWIVYGSTRATRSNIFAVPSSGGERIELTHDHDLTSGPEFTADGQSIIFSSARGGLINLWHMPFRPDGGSSQVPRRLTLSENADVNPSVARGQRKIAYSSMTPIQDIWELTVSSGSLRRVTSESGIEQEAVPSPDGQHLAVVSVRGGASGVWIIDMKGSFKRFVGAGTLPSWSPRGDQIASTAREGVIVRSISDLSSSVITDAAWSTWNPEGTKIAFNRYHQGRAELWVRDMRTGREEQLASADKAFLSLAWSKDGRHIIFNSDVADSRRLLVVPATGGTPRVVPTDDAEYSHPACSPVDPDLVLCVRDHIDLVVVSVSTGKVTVLKKFNNPSIRLTDYPSWSPDGKKVYFDQLQRSGDIFVMEY